MSRADEKDGEARMTDRTELLEATLDIFPEGIALVSAKGQIAFWNKAAEAITGYAGMELLSRQVPGPLAALMAGPGEHPGRDATVHAVLVHVEHKLRIDVLVSMRMLVLRNDMGARIGTAVIFHPAENEVGLPHGEFVSGSSVEKEQTAFQARLQKVFLEFQNGGACFGVMWITVDQAEEMRKTHGDVPCNAMIERVERVLANGLRENEELGRWGDDEFMVLSHEGTAETLTSHAKVLANLAKSADFEWWGDKVAITVSIGVAQAAQYNSLVDLLEKAKAAMFTSYEAGGNQITSAAGGQ
jgi:diguanylate cyclase (GGDEF)-like protein